VIVNFSLNGKPVTAELSPSLRLVDALRNHFGLTGTKEGCAIGECGACSVVMNGRAVNSCLVMIGQVEGAEILTIEGLANGAALHPLQRSFIRSGAIQCGFCTPGMILSAYALLIENPRPTDDEIALALAGNLCRCTGYKQIVDAVRMAAAEMNTP
jgi:aerobic carbon-monoxide dehydrogenase small subunit